MAWVYLLIASALEILWAISLKHTDGYTKLWPSLINVVIMVANLLTLSRALKTLPIGTAYSLWTGIGAIGIVLAGIFFYGEDASPIRLGFIALIIVGIVGLKMVTAH